MRDGGGLVAATVWRMTVSRQVRAGDKAGLTAGDVRRFVAELDAAGAGDSTPVEARVSWRGRLRELVAQVAVVAGSFDGFQSVLNGTYDGVLSRAQALAGHRCVTGCTVAGPHTVCETDAGTVADMLADPAYRGESPLDAAYAEGWKDARDHPPATPRYPGCFDECNRTDDHWPALLGCAHDGICLLPVPCRHCMFLVVPSRVHGWTHDAGSGPSGPGCPDGMTHAEPDRPHCVEGCNRLAAHDGWTPGACMRNGVPVAG